MTDNTQPEALRLAELLTADEWPGHMTLVSYARECVAELRRQHTRIAELEAQLESIGAGGVSGPLVGHPQAMPDLSQLTERGAKAWAGVDAQGLRDGAASAGSEPVAVDGWLHENGLLYRLTDERHPCNRDEINVTMADGSRSIDSRSRRALELLDRIRAAHPSPPGGMVSEQALRKVLSVVQRYLPPDGPSIQDAMSEIIAIVDPWPLGPLEKP